MKNIENQLTYAFHYGKIYKIQETLEHHKKILGKLERFFNYFLDHLSMQMTHDKTGKLYKFYNKKLDEYQYHSRIIDLCNYYLSKED